MSSETGLVHPSPAPRAMRAPLALLPALALAALAFGAPADDDGRRLGGPIVEIPVAFTIRNDNAAPPPTCLADGGQYTLAGHIVGPRWAIRNAHPKTISILTGGFDASSAWLWRGFDELPGYDTAFELARLGGHVTLSLDPLGYGESGRPVPGDSVCFGSQAEVLHQVVQQLRAGSYATCRRRPVAFSRVMVVAHDIGPAMANLEAHLYRPSDIDGLVNIIWANQGFTPFIIGLAAERSAQCAAGGDGSGADFADGYVLFGPPDEEFAAELFFDVDPPVQQAVLARRERNPCGYLFPFNPARQSDASHLADIDVPVLLMFPEEDPVFTREGQEQQAAHFASSPSVTTVFLQETAHFPMFERNAACFRELLSDWLADPGSLAQRFGGPVGSACALGTAPR